MGVKIIFYQIDLLFFLYLNIEMWRHFWTKKMRNQALNISIDNTTHAHRYHMPTTAALHTPDTTTTSNP